ncbi:SMC family ATPase, partial [Candidatus Woesearchaeota archaeon]|nr:SMC family ATPase [Candidatus Woesearchaeota archaeon]
MLLKSVKLENIRSYLNQQIEFPEGSTLLSGDIGSGKSTILLAVEFALFGTRGKKLSGNALLRNGKNEGSVELKFSINEKDIIVKRVLKRKKERVEQDSGYIIIDDVKKPATAVELKTMILDLIGYPKELVGKTKDLVYRYTVYTPQEEMKEILMEDEELRKDTLRKVFGIDKYKRIENNCVIVVREIKGRRKELLGKISDLEEKRQQKANAEKEIEGFDKEINGLIPKLELAKEEVDVNRKLLAEVEVNIQEYNS